MKGEGSLNEKKEMKEGEKKSEENEERQRDAESKNIFNEERSIDIGSRRAMDMRCNRRVILPKDMTPKEEAMLSVRKEAWLKPVDKFIEKNCDAKGNIKEKNTTRIEGEGLKMLGKESRMAMP